MFSVREVPNLLENTPKSSKRSNSRITEKSTHVKPDKEAPKVLEHTQSIRASQQPKTNGKKLEESTGTEKDLVESQVMLPNEGLQPSGPKQSSKIRSGKGKEKMTSLQQAMMQHAHGIYSRRLTTALTPADF